MDDDTSSSSSEGDYRGAVAFRYDASLLAADPNDPDQPSTSGGNAATSEQAARMPPNLKSGGVDVLRQPVQLSGFVATRPEQFRSHDYKSERERLESFAGFPSMTVDVRQLAAAGFWYTKCEDIVRCAFCNVEVGRWEEGDDPMVEHHKWSKNCSFLKHVDVGNVPVDPSNPPPLPSLEQTGFDECGIYNIKKSDNCPIIPSLERLGIQKRYTPAHPEFTTLEARLQSFNSWPIGLKLKPQELAEAGFFYTGLGDKTVCFQCGGGLKDWAESDEPWREHALYFSKCAFVVQTKGREFVAEVLGKRPPTLSPEEIRALAIPKEYSSILHQRPQAVGHSASPAETAQTSSGSSGNNPCPEDTPSNANQPKKLDDARACKICFSEEIGVAFLPCGHLVSCVNCVSSLTTCAVCRKPFSATVRVFMS